MNDILLLAVVAVVVFAVVITLRAAYILRREGW